MTFLQSSIGQRILITLLALAALITSRFVPDFREMLGMAASAMFAWAWLKRPGDEKPTKTEPPKGDDDEPPQTPRSGAPPPIAAASLFCLALFGCSSLTRAERIRTGIGYMRHACKLASVYPAEVPADVRPELDEVCLALDAGKAEAGDAGAE